ncbi:hypothetical protein [Microcystis sp.]|uniref:hypothetical protein n=1 Tax=Microcystis sp. TaxID=1127 RepID=UPI003AF91FE6
MVSEFIELRSPTGNNRPTGNYRPTRFWGIWGEFGLFGRTQCAPTGFWGVGRTQCAPTGFGGIWVIWAHAMRPYGFWGNLGYLGGIWVIWAHAMRPYGFLGGWAHAMRPYGFLGEFGNLGARDAPLRVLDAAEGEKPPHQVNLDTFREKIFLHRESLK